MVLRLIEVYVPSGVEKKIFDIVQPDQYIWIRFHYVDKKDDLVLIRILTTIQWDEQIIDAITKMYSVYKGFELVVFAPRTASPLPKDENRDSDKRLEPIPRMSRQELYISMFSTAQLSFSTLLMVILSSVVAAIGLYKNDPAIIIGAMVMAPFLGPNMALGLGVTLADVKLIFKSMRALLMMLFVSLVLGIVFGLLLPVNPSIPQIQSRTSVDILAVFVALASGAAGTISTVTGQMMSLVGVMVAVALLPPFITFAMLLGAGYFASSFQAFMLFFANIIGVNLASVIVFRVYGITPMSWWDKKKARRLATIASFIWLILLILLVIVVVGS